MADESQDTPVLDTIAAMTAVSVAECELTPDALMLVRLAALAAVDAGPASYLLNIGPAAEAGITIEDAQNVLVAVAPIIGQPGSCPPRSTSPRPWSWRLR